MGWRVVWSEESLANLRDIVSYIAEESPDIAVRFGDGLVDKVLTLADFPQTGSPYRILNGRTIRKLSYRPYRVFYQLDETLRRVDILSIRHGAMDEPSF